ncbi:MarR family winged helix-turn-helix transcriptional regulator [Sulfitobacter dubius]|uniref:MarR family winged helix-turn-helix transcriptional regulator n=1 Tax=Sulfitobacter dubius TaxID=218673 RepID=UPI0022AF27F1|nr:MarR family transcriptional regulator [Sulfitobacter dubius]MCZ4368805.1 MarR family transcriptional regulator [Sulfitobacter dubius]
MHQPIDSDTSFFLLLDIGRLIRAEFEYKVNDAALGITPGEARTLANIARFGPLSQNELADISGFGAMSVTRVLGNLEKAGLVCRSINPNDRRVRMVQVTEKATPLLSELASIGDEVRTITRWGMSTKNWRAFESMLKISRDNHLTAYRARRTAEIEPD